MLRSRPTHCALLASRHFLVCVLLALCVPSPLRAATPPAAPSGLAWQVRGAWHLHGAAGTLRAGDPVPPASLLEPSPTAEAHSITILLPDGQRILYECFAVADCSRGFRVPSLVRNPDAFAVDMLARIGASIAGHRDDPSANRPGQTAREELAAVLRPGHRVHIAGLAATLPNGRYTAVLRLLRQPASSSSELSIQKTAPYLELTMPGPGLYTVLIADAQNAPRIDLLLAAILPNRSSYFAAFERARRQMEAWNDDYAGWPIDDFLRAYLESLSLTSQPRILRNK